MKLLTIKNILLKASEVSTKARRSLGIGYIGLAHYLAKLKLSYNDKQAWKEVDELTEAFQFYLLKASNEIAQEKGQCDYFHRTKYSDGIYRLILIKKKLMKSLIENCL